MINIYKGTDIKVRAVNLKTATDELKNEPNHKLVKLPINEN